MTRRSSRAVVDESMAAVLLPFEKHFSVSCDYIQNMVDAARIAINDAGISLEDNVLGSKGRIPSDDLAKFLMENLIGTSGMYRLGYNYLSLLEYLYEQDGQLSKSMQQKLEADPWIKRLVNLGTDLKPTFVANLKLGIKEAAKAILEYLYDIIGEGEIFDVAKADIGAIEKLAMKNLTSSNAKFIETEFANEKLPDPIVEVTEDLLLDAAAAASASNEDEGKTKDEAQLPIQDAASVAEEFLAQSIDSTSQRSRSSRASVQQQQQQAESASIAADVLGEVVASYNDFDLASPEELLVEASAIVASRRSGGGGDRSRSRSRSQGIRSSSGSVGGFDFDLMNRDDLDNNKVVEDVLIGAAASASRGSRSRSRSKKLDLQEAASVAEELIMESMDSASQTGSRKLDSGQKLEVRSAAMSALADVVDSHSDDELVTAKDLLIEASSRRISNKEEEEQGDQEEEEEEVKQAERISVPSRSRSRSAAAAARSPSRASTEIRPASRGSAASGGSSPTGKGMGGGADDKGIVHWKDPPAEELAALWKQWVDVMTKLFKKHDFIDEQGNSLGQSEAMAVFLKGVNFKVWNALMRFVSGEYKEMLHVNSIPKLKMILSDAYSEFIEAAILGLHYRKK